MRGKVFLLGAMSALGSMAIHMFVPAMPSAARDLSVSTGMIQLAITSYLLGMVIGQIGSGPLSDHYGRRPVLLGGIGLFMAGSLACGLSPGIAWLLAGRLVQALGGASMLVAARAMIMDMAGDRDATHDMAGMAMIVLVSPAISPALGGLLVGWFGWRAMFFILAVIGMYLSTVTRNLPHIVQNHGPTDHRTSFVASWIRILRNRQFLRLTFANSLLAVCLYMFLATAPFLLTHAGMSPQNLGFWLLPIACFAILGARILRSIQNPQLALNFGRGALFLGLALLAVGAWFTSINGPTLLIVPMCIFALGSGITGPVAQAGALGIDAKAVGTSSSLFGAIQMLVSAVGTAIVAAVGIDSTPKLAAILLLVGTLGLLLFPRGGSRPEPALAVLPLVGD